MLGQVTEEGLHLRNKIKAAKSRSLYSSYLGLPSIQREVAELNLGFSCYTDEEGVYHTELHCKCVVTSVDSVPCSEKAVPAACTVLLLSSCPSPWRAITL